MVPFWCALDDGDIYSPTVFCNNIYIYIFIVSKLGKGNDLEPAAVTNNIGVMVISCLCFQIELLKSSDSKLAKYCTIMRILPIDLFLLRVCIVDNLSDWFDLVLPLLECGFARCVKPIRSQCKESQGP